MHAANEKYMYLLLFKLKVYQSFGDSFQQLISSVLFHAMPGFQSIQPYGNWGDGGNDGWIQTDDHYFQVYGPKPTTQSSPLSEVKKAITDFHKLPSKWGHVKKYSFVLNDHFLGVPAQVAAELKNLQQNAGLLGANVIGANELLQFFMQLPDYVKIDIVGGIPTSLPDFVDDRAVKDLLSYLIDNISGSFGFLAESAPIFEEKIVFNGISEAIGSRLRQNSYQINYIDDYLDAVDDSLKQSVAEEVNKVYKQSLIDIASDTPNAADLRYLWMMDKLIPPTVHDSNKHSLAAYRQAAELVLAKYFETCDAYEHPSSLVTAQAR
jgi:hypothetical protein